VIKTPSESIHKFGYTDPKEFVIDLLDSGWEASDAFLEALGEQCPDLDPDDVEIWLEEWKRETDC